MSSNSLFETDEDLAQANKLSRKVKESPFMLVGDCWIRGRRSDWSLQIPEPGNHEHQRLLNAIASGRSGNGSRVFDRWIGLHHGQGVSAPRRNQERYQATQVNK